MKILLIYSVLIILSLVGCRTQIQSTKSHTQPNNQTVLPHLNFNFETSKSDTEKTLLLKLSKSQFQLDTFEDNPYDISFSYSGSPELYVDCGKTTIVNRDDDEVIDQVVLDNSRSDYSFKQYRRNHLDTYQIQNDLKMNADVVILESNETSNVFVKTNYQLTTKREVFTTQGRSHKKFNEFKLHFNGTERKFSEAFGSYCQSTGKFENMISEIINH